MPSDIDPLTADPNAGLDAIPSIQALAAHVASPAWAAQLDRVHDVDGYERLRRALDAARARLSPEHASAELQALMAQAWAGPAEVDPALARRIAEVRASLPIADHARLFAAIDRDLAARFPWAGGGVGLSDRARRADNLFCDYTGRSYLAGAVPDRHGNPTGSAYDLAPDGAYLGQTVHVLHLCAEGGFDFSLPRKALATKGFAVDRRTDPGSAPELRAWLADARQLWVISARTLRLNREHIDAISAFWARGGSLYVWGDNNPYYADANAVLAAVVGDGFALDGDVPGGKVVDAFADGRGFQPHPVTTGLAHLFEGITVASIGEGAAASNGFVELLRGSAGNLITVVRAADARGGALIVDGAFTRLYCNWDDAGSARYVGNAAAYLAGPAPAAVADGAFSSAGAFAGVCDWTGADGKPWLVVPVGVLTEPLANTDDASLDDPLGAGTRDDNAILVDAIYTEAMGRWLLSQPEERRRAPGADVQVVGCLPLVDLGEANNLAGFVELLCACWMGGKHLPMQAQLVWFGVVDRMRDKPDARHPEVWRWLYRQALTWLRATPDLGDVGPTVPLLDAFAAVASSAADDRVVLRLSAASAGLIGRTLVREGRATPEAAARLVRRAEILDQVRERIRAERATAGVDADSVWDGVLRLRADAPEVRAAWG